MSSESPFVHNNYFEWGGGCLGFFFFGHVSWLSILEASFLD